MAGLEGSLIDFVEAAWPSIDPAQYQRCWAIDALCEHLQAVTEGQIPRLLVNYPPRCAKTNVTSICFPAWTWARREKTYLSGSQVRFLTGSYNDDLALQNALQHRRLILSPWYQARWGDRFAITADQNTKTQFDTSTGGSRRSSSARGSLLGLGGDIVVVDDPHNTKQAESELERLTALNWWKELSTTRLNDPKHSALVVIMQRLHEEDISGTILGSDDARDWVHLCIPMEYDWNRHCVTTLGWQDPRGLDEEGDPLVLIGRDGARVPRDAGAETVLETECQNTLMWPERFGPNEVAKIKAGLGPYMASGRLQQMPTPERGGIFQRAWWQLYESTDGKFPAFDYILASLDSAFTEKEENDPSGFTVWGIWSKPSFETGTVDEKTGHIWQVKGPAQRRIMLVHAWRKHLAFSAARSLIERRPNEPQASWKRRTQEHWGLMEWVNDTCNRFKVDKLLIEAKASGISAAQELQNRFGRQAWAVQLCPVQGDKVARALAVQPTFSQGMVYAPSRDWAEMVIDEMAVFPKGKFKDLTDSATQAVKYLRDIGLAQTDDEQSAAQTDRVTHRSQPSALYPV